MTKGGVMRRKGIRRKVVEIIYLGNQPGHFQQTYATAILSCGHEAVVSRVRRNPTVWPKTSECMRCMRSKEG
jgi:hypothetical protein